MSQPPPPNFNCYSRNDCNCFTGQILARRCTSMASLKTLEIEILLIWQYLPYYYPFSTTIQGLRGSVHKIKLNLWRKIFSKFLWNVIFLNLSDTCGRTFGSLVHSIKKGESFPTYPLKKLTLELSGIIGDWKRTSQLAHLRIYLQDKWKNNVDVNIILTLSAPGQ